jgi:hypothetical protein
MSIDDAVGALTFEGADPSLLGQMTVEDLDQHLVRAALFRRLTARR